MTVLSLTVTAARNARRRPDCYTLADLRGQLRRFLRVSEVAARQAGVESWQ
jgi:hypothetical protein